MKSYAQSHQDLFVLAMLNGKTGGTYLDVGCFHPKEGNNTYLLDVEHGWNGVNIDWINQDFTSSGRVGWFMKCDATKEYPPHVMGCINSLGGIDYLSLDVDEATNEALPIALSASQYKIITIEHDLYARGKENQQQQRDMLQQAGYKLQVADVYPHGRPELIFEDWWVSADLFDQSLAQSGPTDSFEFVEELWRYKFNDLLTV